VKFCFICGAPRSGTTLLSNLLDGHPETTVFPGESSILRYWLYYNNRGKEEATRFFHRDYLNTFEILALTDNNTAKEHSSYLERVYGKSNYQRPDIDRRRFVSEYRSILGSLGFRLRSVYAASLLAGLPPTFPGNKSTFVVKRPLEHEMGALVLNEASKRNEIKFLHIVRDPRTRYISAKMRRPRIWRWFRTFDNFVLTHSEIGMVSLELAILNRQILGSEKYYVVRYEDLVHSPQEEMEKVADYLGISFSNDLIKQDNHPLSSFFRGPDPDGRLEDYKKHTTEGERRIVNFLNHTSAKSFGYILPYIERLTKKDFLMPFKYENPLAYFKTRSGILKELRGNSSVVRMKRFHKLLDAFGQGETIQD